MKGLKRKERETKRGETTDKLRSQADWRETVRGEAESDTNNPQKVRGHI